MQGYQSAAESGRGRRLPRSGARSNRPPPQLHVGIFPPNLAIPPEHEEYSAIESVTLRFEASPLHSICISADIQGIESSQPAPARSRTKSCTPKVVPGTAQGTH